MGQLKHYRDFDKHTYKRIIEIRKRQLANPEMIRSNTLYSLKRSKNKGNW